MTLNRARAKVLGMSLVTDAMQQAKQLAGSFDVNAPGRNIIRVAWDKLSPLPGGKRAFSLFVGRAARYTGSIRARVVELRHLHSQVEMDDTPAVRNHLKSVHAVALVNLAEMAGNLAVAYSLPDDARFIVAGLDIEYVKKARGTITAQGEPPELVGSEKREYDVPVTMRDGSGEIVARCTLRTLVGPKKS